MTTCTVAVIRKTSVEEIRVTREAYLGDDVIRVRLWVGRDGARQPYKAGVRIPLPLAADVAAAITKASKKEGGV